VCIEVSSHPLLPDEPSPLGFTPNEAAASALGTHSQTVQWADGATSALTLAVNPTGEANFVRLRPEEEETARLDRGCPDQLDLGAILTLNAEDGTFDETWEVVLHSTHAGVSYETVQFVVLEHHRRLIELGAEPGSALLAEFFFAPGARHGAIRTIGTVAANGVAKNGSILASF